MAGGFVLTLAVVACTMPVQLRTAAAPEQACDSALAKGTLVRESTTGLGLEVEPGRVLPVVWPYHFSARSDAGSTVLVDPGGTVLASEGEVIEMGGSLNKAGTWIACARSIRVVPPGE